MKATPHIDPQAPIAETILLPGDPLRAKFIAETYLEDAVQFNSVRNMLGFTGTYQGTPVSVMGSGMGIPSISLYSWELIHVFGCKKLIRIGSCGAMQPGVNLYDVVIGQAACSNSAFMDQYDLPGTYAPIASFRLIEAVRRRAEENGVTTHVGNILSSDTFYNADETFNGIRGLVRHRRARRRRSTRHVHSLGLARHGRSHNRKGTRDRVHPDDGTRAAPGADLRKAPP